MITVRRKPCSTCTPPVDPRNIYMVGRQPMQGNKQIKAVVSYQTSLCSKWYRGD